MENKEINYNSDYNNNGATTEDWPPKCQQNPDTALVVNEGVEEKPIINPYIKRFFKKKPALLSVEEYMKGITEGNTTILSQAITLVESYLPAHREIAQKIIAQCHVTKCAKSILYSFLRQYKLNRQYTSAIYTRQTHLKYISFSLCNSQPDCQGHTQYTICSE